MNHLVENVSYFNDDLIASRLLSILHYYRSTKAIVSFSRCKRMNEQERQVYLQKLTDTTYFRVTIYAYCIMPTHIHLLVQQKVEGGISNYLSLCENAIAKYVNTYKKRKGRLFRAPFTFKHIESDVQFLHVSRYIHNNPYASLVVKNIQEICKYSYSSLHEYMTHPSICDTTEIMHYFHSPKDYLTFVISDTEGQRERKLSTL